MEFTLVTTILVLLAGGIGALSYRFMSDEVAEIIADKLGL